MLKRRTWECIDPAAPTWISSALCGRCVWVKGMTHPNFTKKNILATLKEQEAFSVTRVQLAVVMWVLMAAQCVNTCWSTVSRTHTGTLSLWRSGFRISLTYNFKTSASVEDVIAAIRSASVTLNLWWENSKVTLTPIAFTLSEMWYKKWEFEYHIEAVLVLLCSAVKIPTPAMPLSFDGQEHDEPCQPCTSEAWPSTEACDRGAGQAIK